MACIPAGPFIRGKDDDPHRCVQGGQPLDRKPASVPAATIELAAFLIDIHEVTFAEFRACADDKTCRNVRPLYYDFDRPRQPMVGVSWFDAADYCRFVGKRLPTEAEWEKAARGPDGEDNPFGNVPITCDNAVVMNEDGRSCGVKKQGGKPDTGRVLEIMSRPPGRYGLYDMAGNAEEWVADWWTKSYDACGDACLGKDPKGPCDGAPKKCRGHHWKVVKGGSWYWPAEHTAGYHRRRHFPQNDYPHYHHFGFRCAADVGAKGAR